MSLLRTGFRILVLSGKERTQGRESRFIEPSPNPSLQGRGILKHVLKSVCICAVVHAAALGQQSVFPPKATFDDVRQAIAGGRHVHPRLLASGEELKGLAESAGRDPLKKAIADTIVRQAVALEDAEPVERKLQGKRLLSVSRRCVQRVLVLATAYHLTGDKKYAARAQKEMLAAARFRDWNPAHFLDVGEMTFALAIGYDWLYDQLDEPSRQEIRAAIVEKGLRVPFETKFNAWVRSKNNWGQVCHGGLTSGALAVMDEEPELAARTIESALKNVPLSMAAYAPQGSYPEGPGYWSYGTSYNVLLIACLESALGKDFGLTTAPGFSETGAYPALVCGPSGLFFNYADGSAKRTPEPVRLWFASRFERPDWLVGEKEFWAQQLGEPGSLTLERSKQLMPLALIWMKDSAAAGPVKMPLNWSPGGSVPISIFRSSWTDPRATFVGVKAGLHTANHRHLDAGTFVLDSDGARWATDLGAEGYYGIESRNMKLWAQEQNADRWNIFRLNNFSHNTLVIDAKLQVAGGDSSIVEFSDDAARPYSIVDMSGVYKGQAKSVRRGVMLLPSREVLIQDELTGLRPGSRVRWGMVTPGKPGELGKKSVVLKQGKEKLVLAIHGVEDASWHEIDTAKPRHEWDTPNPGTRMMAFEVETPPSGKVAFAVVATPGSCEEPTGAELRVESLKDWGKRR